MSLPPHVRIELSVDAMRHQVVHQLALHQKEVQELVDAEVTQYIESGALTQRLQQSVRKYLDEAVDSAVKSAITSWAKESPTVSKAVERAVHEALWAREDG